MRRTTLLGTLGALASAISLSAQTVGGLPPFDDRVIAHHPLSLAPGEAEATGGGGATEAKNGPSEEELAKAVQNPVADLISVPFQNNFNFGIGPNHVTQWVLNVQPVIPISLNKDWNLITRTILPIINQPSPGPGVPSAFGLGDLNPTFFFSPVGSKELIWGVGPTFTFPTATDSSLGMGKWSAGPAVVVLTMQGHWVIGALCNNQWSFAGWGNQSVNAMLVQPFVNYNLPHGWYLTSSPIITADWNANSDNRWTVPIGGGVGKIVKLGKLPLNLQLAGYGNVEKPQNGADWQLRFQVQFLFPK